MTNQEVVTEGKQLDRLKKLGIIAGMTAFGGGIGLARHNTHSPNTGTRIVDGSAIPAGVTGAGGGALIGSLMAGNMVASSKRNRDLKKHLKKSKETRDMKNEEYTQILEQMIISLTGMELEELHEAVGGHLKEGTGYSAEEVKSGKTRSGRPHPEARFPGWKVGKNMLKKVKKGKKKSMIEDYQTPARNAQMQDMYDRAEGAFFKDLSSDEKLRKLWGIDNKSNAEQQSSRLYGKNGKLIKQTKKKKRVRIGQPFGKQGGYQG